MARHLLHHPSQEPWVPVLPKPGTTPEPEVEMVPPLMEAHGTSLPVLVLSLPPSSHGPIYLPICGPLGLLS